jgi:transcriptional regulator with XRE-family HTH domain
MGFNNWLINQMDILNLSRSAIARDLEVHKSTVDKWVNGLAVPRVKHLYNLCTILANGKDNLELYLEASIIICGD